MNHDAHQNPGDDVVAELPVQFGTVGELAALLARFSADTPLRLTGAIRVDPVAAANGHGVAVPVASLEPRRPDSPAFDFVLQVSLMVLADVHRPVPPESGYPLNPLDRLHEALVHDDDLSGAAAAAADTLNRVSEYLADPGFPARMHRMAERLRHSADHLVDETTILELEKGL